MKPASLTRSGDFRRVYAGGKRSRRNGVGVACLDRSDEDPTRVGYSVKSSAGPAVTRNRIKRRLRAAVRALDLGPGFDVVITGDSSVATMEFQILVDKLGTALRSTGVGA